MPNLQPGRQGMTGAATTGDSNTVFEDRRSRAGGSPLHGRSPLLLKHHGSAGRNTERHDRPDAKLGHYGSAGRITKTHDRPDAELGTPAHQEMHAWTVDNTATSSRSRAAGGDARQRRPRAGDERVDPRGTSHWKVDRPRGEPAPNNLWSPLRTISRRPSSRRGLAHARPMSTGDRKI